MNLKQRNRCFSRLSKKLSEEYNTRSIGIRTGDTVTILRGNFRGVEGKVTKVNRKKNFLNIEGVTREKVNGDKVILPIHPSNVIISKLNLEDKRRKDVLKRKTNTRKNS